MLAITLGTGAIGLVFMSASIPGDFAYATHSLGVGKLAFGFVLTAWAIGMIVASNMLFGRIPAAAVATATLIGAAVQGLAKFVAPFWQLYVVMLVAWAIGGMGHGIKNTGFRTLIHQRVDAAQHGRAFAAFNGLRNTAELAALAGGAGARDDDRRPRHALGRRRHLGGGGARRRVRARRDARSAGRCGRERVVGLVAEEHEAHEVEVVRRGRAPCRSRSARRAPAG